MSLAGYAYYKKGAVNATTAGAQTLYQLELIVGESSGASGADVHCENHCLDFPNDVRFTKEDGETKHDYWVEGITGTTPNRKATVWIEVTSIPASGSVDFYMYYRKTSDSGESDGNNTFVAFDDFEVTPTLNPWTRYSGNPVLPKNPSSPSADYYFVNNGKILKNVSENPKTPYKDGSDRYYMYYCGSGNIDGLDNDQTFLARSTDLITWTRVGVVIPFGNGTFQDGAWDDADTQMGTVLYDSDSSTFMMWYNGNNNPSSDYSRLGYATSANGINWTKYAGNPILSQGPDGDADDLYAPIVIKDGSTWKMWYAGQKAGGGRIALMYATASNPEGPWTKYSTAHIYDPGYNFFPAEVWKESGTYHMIFFPLTVTDLRHATSPDGITWTYDAIIFERGESAEWDDHHIQEVSQILIGSTWYSFYTGGGAAGVFSIGYATSSARIPTPATDPLDDWGGQTASYGALDDRAFDGDYSLKKTGANGEANAYIYLTETTADIEIWLRVWNGDALDKRGGVFIGTSGDADHYYCAYLSVWDSGNTIRFLEFNNGGYVSDKGFQNIGAISPNQWCKVVLRRVGTTWTAYAYLEDGTLLGSKEITLSITSGFVGIHFYDTATYMDQFLARKYASPEPTWGSWGAEIGGSTPLAGVIAATSTLSGALNVQKSLAGVIAATSTLSGALNVQKSLAGVIAASSSVTGTLGKQKALVGVIGAVSTVEGKLVDIEILRPNAPGDLTEITYQNPGSGAHWEKVDEASADEGTTTVYIDGTASVLTDIYNLQNSSGLGGIDSIEIYVRAKEGGFANGKLRIMSKTHGVLYQSSEVTLTTSWATYSTTQTNNPYTGSAWTWAEIDALQVGAKIWDGLGWYEIAVTQVYVKVYYNPKIFIAGVVAGTSAVSGGIDVALSTAGVVAATSSVTGALSVDKPIGGAIDATSTVVGDIDIVCGTKGVIAATSNVTGTLTKIHYLAGVVGATTSVTGDLIVTKELVGAIASTSTVVGALTFGYGLSSYTPLYTESFETNFGDWLSSGELGWTRRSGSTPSLTTGPDSAYDGDWYIYTEASNPPHAPIPGYPYKVSYLTYNGALNRFKHVNFWYHKYGIDCGPLELHAYYGGAWHTVWSRPAGDEGNTWFNAIVDFPDGTTNIRFKSTTGDYAFGDTALDLIIIYSGIDVLPKVTGALSMLRALAGVIGAASTVSGRLGLPRALAGAINAQSTVTGFLTFKISLEGTIAATSTVTGAIEIVRGLTGEIDGASSLSGAIIRNLSLKGIVGSSTTVAGALTRLKLMKGTIAAASTVEGALVVDITLAGVIGAVSELTGAMCFTAATRGFYYAKLGTDNLHNPPETSFRITTELNNIASFDYTVQNDAHNRTIIANNLTDDFSMMRDDGTELLRGSIDSDSIEYYTQGEGRGRGRIRLSGFANFVDLKYLIYKRMADGDAEDVGSVQDQDYTPSDFTNFTTQANNAAVNDVQLTFGGVNDALYIGKNETFFAAKIKYTTKGIQAANTTVVMEYSKGSGVWATLDCIDESYSFTEDAGTYLLYIPNKADDWAKDTVNGKKQYYIRFRLTEGSYSTSPKLDQIKLSNADVCRVQFNDTAADTILGYLLEGTGYTEDATDQCPSTEITIRGEYDSRLRWIYGLGSALTWEDSNGDIQRYDCWIDTSKKVHYKQHRGTDQGDISADFRALSNKIGYGEMGTRIFSTGGQEGINQKKAVVEDLTAQGLHKLREIVLEDNRITAYEGIKEEALKSLANRKNPLKDVTGDLDTKYYLDTTMDVGDKILVHQPDWNLNNQELYIMRAVIGPSETKLDLGNSQIHLEHLRSTLQRQMDIGNVWMHGSVSTYVVGPEEDNYERKDATTAYPLRFTIEVPDNARGINHVEIGWELLPYKSSVGGSGSGGGHSHSSGPSGRDGAHLHNTAASYGGGGHGHSTGGSGLHNHGVSNAGDHWHDVTVTLSYYTAQAVTIVYDTAYAGAHSHSNPNTSGPSSTSSVLYGLNYGSQCTSGYCITGGPTTSVASSGHSHSQGGTGSGGNHYHTTTSGKAYFVTSITQPGGFTTSQHDGHVHPVGYEPAHGHSVTTVDNHAHSIPDTNTEDDHEHTIPESSTEPAHYHVVDYGVYEIPGGTTLELYVGDELVGDTYVGDQSGINITGWITKGHNSITLKPIVGDNVKGRAKMSATCTVFLENLK